MVPHVTNLLFSTNSHAPSVNKMETPETEGEIFLGSEFYNRADKT
jgi:hypothetical protein